MDMGTHQKPGTLFLGEGFSFALHSVFGQDGSLAFISFKIRCQNPVSATQKKAAAL